MRCLFKLVFCLIFVDFAFGTQQFEPRVLYSEKSPFGLIEVVAGHEPNTLLICENKNYSLSHSVITQDDPTYMGEYEQLASSCFVFSNKLKEILLLGLGGGEFLGYMLNYYKDVSLDIVEINPVMINIVKKFRNISTGKNVRFIVENAFKFIAKKQKHYDLIYCDIYFFKPSTQEEYNKFFEKIISRLNEGGIFIFNAHIPSITSSIVEDLLKNFKNIHAAITNQSQNIVFICYQGLAKSKDELEKTAKELQNQYNFRYPLPEILQKFKVVPPEDNQKWIAKFPDLQ